MCHTVRVNMASASAPDVIQTINIGICISTICRTNQAMYQNGVQMLCGHVERSELVCSIVCQMCG